MQKVVINTCFGGFGLSDTAEDLYAKKKGFELTRYKKEYFNGEPTGEYHKVPKGVESGLFTETFTKDFGESFKVKDYPGNEFYWYSGELERTDPILIEVVEELGKEADGQCAALRVVEVPDDVSWYIHDYDGNESINEEHRSWS